MMLLLVTSLLVIFVEVIVHRLSANKLFRETGIIPRKTSNIVFFFKKSRGVQPVIVSIRIHIADPLYYNMKMW